MMRILSMIFILLLSACGNAPSGVGTGTSSSTTTSSTTTTTTTGTTTTTTVTGSVGDGPVSGATLTFTDSTGTVLNVTDNNTTTSGTSAKSTTKAAYSVNIASTASFPVIVTATGGTDLTRSQLGMIPTTPTITMTSVVMDAYSVVAHISPLTTLAVETAKVISGASTFTAAQLTTAKQQVVRALGLGLDSLSADFLTTATASISTADMATLLQASEAVGAIIDRTKNATTGSTETSVVATLAKDISDGALEGLQSGTVLGTQEATNLQQVHKNIQNDLYTLHTIKLDATDITGSTATFTLSGSGLTTLASTIGITLAATDPYAADVKLGIANSNSVNAAPTSVQLLSGASTGQSADGSGSYTVTIQVKDGHTPALPLQGQLIGLTWTSTSGGIVQVTQTATPLVTDSNGTAAVTVTDINSKDDTVKLSATVGALTTPTGSELSLAFTGTGSGTSGGGTTTTASTTSNSITPSQATVGTIVSNGVALNPQQGSPFDLYTVATALDNYGTWASGTHTVQLRFFMRDSAGKALSGQSVNFSVGGSQGGSPQISPSGMNTLSDGYASVTVTDTTAETVTVTATSGSLTASQVVTFFAMDPNTISLKSTTPTTAIIGIAGSGTTSSATITFQMLDVNNNLVQKSHQVDFSITGGGLNGGELLNSSSATSLNGLVSTVLTAGSKAGTVTVHAQLNATPSIGTDATITITGGLPSGDAFILSSSPLNIAGRVVLGLTQTITSFISDFFSNPVAPNIGAQFQTDFANITGSSTFTNGGSGSSATVTVQSAAPQPTDGVVTVAAQTTGGIHSKVLSIAIDPYDSNTIYLGTDGGGVFNTIDGGATWNHFGVPLKDLKPGKAKNLTGTIVRDLRIDPYSSNIVYAATERGLFVSRDNGKGWQTLTGLRRITGEKIGVIKAGSLAKDGRWKDGALPTSDPYSFNFLFSSTRVRSRTHVYLNGTEIDSYLQNGTKGIQLIGDFANQLNQQLTADYDAWGGISDAFPISSVLPMGDSVDVYGHSKTIYIGTLGNGVWKTIDGGNSWSKASGMAQTGQSFNLQVLSLAVDAYNSNLLFAGTNGGGLFYSVDSANTWNKAAATLAESTVQTIISRQPYTWIGGKNGIHYSADSYTTWHAPNKGVNNSNTNNRDVRVLAYDYSNNVVYAATFGDVLHNSDPYGGVFYSDNAGIDWYSTTNVGHVAGAHAIDALDVYSQTGNGLLVVGSEGRLVSVSSDKGSNWVQKPGVAPSNLNNTLFTTIQVMHSGHTAASLIPQTMKYQPLDAYTFSGGGYGSSSTIYNGGNHTFYLHVSDDLGNRLIAGSTISATVTGGSLTGDTNVTVADGVFGGGDYQLTWTNNLATVSTTDVVAALNVAVTSTNGSKSVSLSRTLVNPVNGTAPAVTDTYSKTTAYTSVTVTGAGGSNGANGYTFTAGLGCNHRVVSCTGAGDSKTITTAAGVKTATFEYVKATAVGTVTDTITIQDNLTKKSSSPVTVTITYQ